MFLCYRKTHMTLTNMLCFSVSIFSGLRQGTECACKGIKNSGQSERGELSSSSRHFVFIRFVFTNIYPRIEKLEEILHANKVS